MSTPIYLFIEKVPEAKVGFYNLRKLRGIYEQKGQNRPTPEGSEELEPTPSPDELVGWFRHHPYLKTSRPEPATVGGFKGVQFDVACANLQKKDTQVEIFGLSTGCPSTVYYLK